MSHLLLLGPTRVGDLIKTLNTSHNKNMDAHTATNSALPDGTSTRETHLNGETNGDSSFAQENINATLCLLLQYGLISPAHERTVRSDTENRMEADRICAKLRDDKLKSEKARNNMQEAQVRKLLHQWKFGTRKERTQIKALSMVQKRSSEDLEDPPAAKRQRLDLDASKYAVNSEDGGSAQLTSNNLLKVWRYDGSCSNGLRF